MTFILVKITMSFLVLLLLMLILDLVMGSAEGHPSKQFKLVYGAIIAMTIFSSVISLLFVIWSL